MKIYVYDNPELENRQEYEHNSLPDFCVERFETFPNCKMYRKAVRDDCEIPLVSETDVEDLFKIDDEIHIVIFPQGLAAIGLLLIGATVAIKVIKNKKNKKASTTNEVQQSPNNEITNRQNRQRFNQRIPDIFGTVRAIPDLIAEPYFRYKQGYKIEYSYMCLGRGDYSISDIKEGDILVSDIDQSFAEFYGPNKSPNNSSPDFTIGGEITEPLYNVEVFDQVEEQELLPPDSGFVWTPWYTVNNLGNLNLNIVSDKIIPDYALGGGANAPRLAYMDCQVEYLNEDETPIGGIITYNLQLSHLRGPAFKAVGTFELPGSAAPKARIRVARTYAYRDPGDGIPREDVITLESIWTQGAVTQASFGNITTIYTAIIATEENQNLSNREFNCLATRRVRQVQADGTAGTDYVASRRFHDILLEMSLDERIGGRTEDELDLTNWHLTYSAINQYFGSNHATEFGFTFDDLNISYEEMMTLVCNACFCDPYREGKQIKLSFEKANDASTLLFNHRNKIPNSEIRTIEFGTEDDHDGVELEWVDEETGDPEKTYLPTDRSALNPDRVKIQGVQNGLQAYFHAQRLWAKIKYQNQGVEFDATFEAATLRFNDRILVADNTRIDTIDGEIIGANGTTLTLSQAVDLDSEETYTIFVQLADGTIQSTSVVQGTQPNQVVIGAALSGAISVDLSNFARSTFEIVQDTNPRTQAFLVLEKTYQSGDIVKVEAGNYDARFYAHDDDFNQGIVTVEGVIV